MKKEWCIYKYINRDDGEVIYVGKTDSSLKQRIDSHEREDKFQPYRGNWDIYYFRLSNRVETDIVEKFLINKLKPVLNEKDLEEGLSLTGLTLPKWEPYSKYESELAKDGETLRQKERNARNDLALYADALDGLANGGIFYSRTLHPTGLLPFMGMTIRMTDRNVLRSLSQKTFLYEQHLSKEGMKILKTCPKQLELSIYREVTLEMNVPINEKCSVLWEFVRRLEEYAQNGCQEGEMNERFTFTVTDHAPEFQEFFKDLYASFFQGHDRTVFEIPDLRPADLIPIKEKIAGMELMDIKALDVLREEEASLEEIHGWDFGI